MRKRLQPKNTQLAYVIFIRFSLFFRDAPSFAAPARLCCGTAGKMWKPQDLCGTYFSFYGSRARPERQQQAKRMAGGNCQVSGSSSAPYALCASDLLSGYCCWAASAVIFLQSCCGKSEKLQRQPQPRHNLQRLQPGKCAGTVCLSHVWVVPKKNFFLSIFSNRSFLFPHKTRSI